MGPGNFAHFSNFEYTSMYRSQIRDKQFDKVKNTAISDKVLQNWQLSQVFEASQQSANEIPKSLEWQKVAVEAPGMVNISRTHANLARQERSD